MSRPPYSRRVVESDVSYDDSFVSFEELRRQFEFVGCYSQLLDARSIFPRGVLMPVEIDNVSIFVEEFHYLTQEMLRCLCREHGLPIAKRHSHARLVDALRSHSACSCPPRCYVFQRLRNSRRSSHRAALPPLRSTVPIQGRQTEQRLVADISRDEVDFPPSVTWEDKRAIIQEWQERLTPSALCTTVCAVCAWDCPPSDLQEVDPCRTDLGVLRNDSLPARVLPTTYNRQAYHNAILHPLGLVDRERCDKFRVCTSCQKSLCAKVPKRPRYSLANFLYYGRDELPLSVSEAFADASPFEMLLISRACSSVITHHYSSKAGMSGFVGEESSQRFNRGNVGIFPQEPGQLRDKLPPSPDDIKDSICVLFTGGKQTPSVDTLKRFRPVLVSKSKVERMINFLVERNEWYVNDGVTYSPENMQALFSPEDEGTDQAVLQHMQISHSEGGDTVEEVDWDSEMDDMVVDNVAYTLGDHSVKSREAMKVQALAYALDNKRFLHSRAGSGFVSESHPGLMSYLFPHLDPWGIGGFNHPARVGEQRLTVEAQVKCLLRQHDSPFRRDTLFPFISWNFIQKQAASTQSTFSIKSESQTRLSERLYALAPQMTDIANK